MWIFDGMGRGRVSTPSSTLSKGQLYIYALSILYIYIWFGSTHGFRPVPESSPHGQGGQLYPLYTCLLPVAALPSADPWLSVPLSSVLGSAEPSSFSY